MGDFTFNPARVLEMLPKLGFGLIIIFVIIGIIILATYLVNNLFKNKK